MEPITTPNGLTVTPENNGRLVVLTGPEPGFRAEIRYQDRLWHTKWNDSPRNQYDPKNLTKFNSVLDAVQAMDALYGQHVERYREMQQQWADIFVPEWERVRKEYEQSEGE